ncbi:DUF6279 family lipoprotein [uncultured Thiodictyon sp.]|uniref:DUF6279 family lipoprotein n=1 Tax=uncultured Thiodictyon sp. TaxID=1846217 RepID=UPI0025E477D9|nr:DUF6279 family lipoprotein [uncultured Thiodictyon sp.]
MNRPRALTRTLLLTLLATLLGLPGCSAIQLAYGTAPFLIKNYADDYLNLDSEQLAQWEPRLKAALDTHRVAELPQLAGFFEAFRKAASEGFDATNAHCLTNAFVDLYRRHARLAVGAAAPLLAQLTPAQVRALDQRFAAEYAKARNRPDLRDSARQVRKRTGRYIERIEEWTGPLRASQRALVEQVSAPMPDTSVAVLEYRTHKRKELIALLRAGANEAAIRDFLTVWLVEYRDLTPPLVSAEDQLLKTVEAILVRLGATLDRAQRKRLTDRLAALRDSLMRLQNAPRMVPVSCRA